MTYIVHDVSGSHPAPFRHTLPPMFNRRATAAEVYYNGRWRRVYSEGFTTYIYQGAARLTVTAS